MDILKLTRSIHGIKFTVSVIEMNDLNLGNLDNFYKYILTIFYSSK